MKLVLASDNKGKLREFGALFADHGIEVVSQGALGVTPCEEPFRTFLEMRLLRRAMRPRQRAFLRWPTTRALRLMLS